jgi:hypothetical protein
LINSVSIDPQRSEIHRPRFQALKEKLAMSAPYYADGSDLDYSSQRIRDRRESDHDSRKSSQPRYARSGRGPTQTNGIHRRRNKRFAW